MAIDDRARLGFVEAERYDTYRPSYPAEAIAYIRDAAKLTRDSVVVDLAAGTGLMTRLLPRVRRLIAVEPLPNMRRVLALHVPGAEVVDGTADRTTLPAAVADAVVVAQAFHWFADAEAVGEIARILKPRGILALVWNVRDAGDPFMERLYEVLAPHRQDSPSYDHVPWQVLFGQQDSPLEVRSEESFSWEEPITLHHLKGRVLSTSYVGRLDEQAQSAVLLKLEGLVGSAGDDTPVLLRHRTKVYIAGHRESQTPRAVKAGTDAHSS